MRIAQDFGLLLSKFMPQKHLKQALKQRVKNNMRVLLSDIAELNKSIEKGSYSTDALIRLIQFPAQELASIFENDQTLEIQKKEQSGLHPKRNAEIHFSNKLQEELWKLNLVGFFKF